jgi:hypothetical protein
MKKIKTTVNRFTNASLHQKALTNAVKLLNAIGVEYAIVNQTVTIPIGQFDLLHVYGSASSTASKVWGNGCHKIGTSEDKKSVILTRTEKLDDMDDLFSQLGIN